MNTCPNCGHQLKGDETICPYCSFNLEKYQAEFFTDRHQRAQKENKKEGERIASRAVYRQEFFPRKQNTVMATMISWMRQNATIAFLIAILLLIITSFSASLGWIVFFILLIWLYIVCDRSRGQIKRYTADKRLTEKVNQIGSNFFNSVADKEEKIKSRHKNFSEKHPQLSEKSRQREDDKTSHIGYIRLSAIVTSLLSLIVLFTGSGASVSEAMSGRTITISRVLLGLANRLLSTNSMQALLLYLIWLLLILLPVFIIINLLKKQRKNEVLALILSLIENIALAYFVVKMINGTHPGSGIFSQITSQLFAYVVSIGTSTYFLLLTSVLTTALIVYDSLRKNKEE